MKRNRLALMARAAAQAAAAPRRGARAALRPLRSGALAGVLGLALVLGAHAGGSGNLDLTWSGPGGGVGTLPSTAGTGIEGLPIGPFAPWNGPTTKGSPGSQSEEVVAPALALRGTDAELDHLIALAYSPDGTGWFHLEDPASSGSGGSNGIRTITFYGNAVVLLERSALRTNVQAPALAVAPPAPSQGPLVAVLKAREGQHAVQALTPGLVPLPLDRALGVGLLKNGLVLEVVERGGAAIARFSFVAEGPQIRVEQRQ
jgi:hypothetical protein